MTTVTISLPESLKAFIDHQLATSAAERNHGRCWVAPSATRAAAAGAYPLGSPAPPG